MPGWLGSWDLAGSPLPAAMDCDCRHCPGSRGRFCADLPDRCALSQRRPMKTFDTYTDEDFKRTIWSALRLVAIAVAVGVPLLWWKLGWQSAALLAIGALISGSGLFEWL